jgi:hypothetical protein
VSGLGTLGTDDHSRGRPRYPLTCAGPPVGPIHNGWIDHGRLVLLKPADGSNVFFETW